MKKIAFSMALAALLCFTVPAHTAITPTVKKLDIRTSEISSGFYDVLVFKDGQWQHAGILRYGSHFQERQLDLSPLLPTEGKIKVRLFQNGGGAAHIDSVQLGDKAPSEVTGCSDPLALNKLLKKDFDVLDAYYKTLDLSFASKGDNKTLAMTARIEPAAISKIPFQFPQHNLFRSMTAGSHFYPYKLTPRNDSPTDKTKAISDKAFFKEYCLTGSGHPSGFTYGWVSNDEKNLYVKLDFTPDNTRDGDKDYAKLYVRRGNNLKEFKVSEVNKKWGNPEFTYTDKAAYQHKVYNFAIPLENLGIEKSSSDEKIDLAFAAYGTATPAYLATDTAYDEEYRRYLIVHVNTNGYVVGQMVNEDGSLFGTEFTISENQYSYYPSIVHNPGAANFLILFESSVTNVGIYGQIVVPNGTLQGSNFLISEPVALNPVNAKGAHDDVYNQFLVIWEDERSQVLNKDIYGQVLDGSTLSPLGDNFPVMVAAGNQYDPAVAFDDNAEKYLTAWADDRTGTSYWDIYGRVIDADGTLNGDEFAISAGGFNRRRNPAIAYDLANQLFSVVWEHGLPDPENIFGNFLIIREATYINSSYVTMRSAAPCDLNGTVGCIVMGLFDGDFPVSTAFDYQQNPYIIHDNSEFLMVWDDLRSAGSYGKDIYGRYIGVDSGDLTPDLTSSEFTIVTSSDEESDPSLAYNPRLDDTLLAYRNYTYPTDTYEYFVFGSPGSISGRITEPDTPGPLFDAKVILRDSSGQYWEFFTEADGLYSFADLPPGCYGLQVFPPTTTSYQISVMDYINLAEGEDLANFDVEVEPGAYTISGRVYSGGSGLQYVNVHYDSEEFRRIYQHTQTDENGDYTLTNLPPGKGEISIRADLTNLAFTGQDVDLTGSIGGVDFYLVTESIVTGRVVDESGDGLEGIDVEFYNEQLNADQEAVTDANGYFTIGNLPQGIGYLEIWSDYQGEYCTPRNRAFYIGEGTESNLGTVQLERCALVQGTVNTPPAPDEACDLEVDARGSNFEADGDVINGSYELLLPEGTHLIYLDTSGNGPYDRVAYPVEVPVISEDIGSGIPVDVPAALNVISISNPATYGTIEGNVAQNSVDGPNGQFQLLIGMVPKNALAGITPDKLDQVELIQEMRLDAFGSYTLFPVPPAALPEQAYDIFCALDNQNSNGLNSVTILGWHKGIEIGPNETVTNIDFDFTHTGSDYIDGYITSQYGNPIINARVIVKNGLGDLIGFADTDQNGYYRIYNLPTGNYTMDASHPDLGDASDAIGIPADTTKDLSLGYTATSKIPGVWTELGVVSWATEFGTALEHWVVVTDYDGVTGDGSSHTVIVTYPDGQTKELYFAGTKDVNSAYYELYDSSIPQPIDTGTYDGTYVYRVTDANGDWSEATDDMVINVVDLPAETSFTPNFGAEQSITAFFDNVLVDNGLYDDFQSGYNFTNWEGPPPEVTYPVGELRFDQIYNPGRGSQWIYILNPASVNWLTATVRVNPISTDQPMAKIGGNFARDSYGDIYAELGIRKNEAVFKIHSNRWEGDHFRYQVLVPETRLGNLGDLSPGNNYDLSIKWTGTAFEFSVVGLDDSVNLSDSFTPGGVIGGPNDNWKGLAVSCWLELDTTPTFTWDPVANAKQYRLRVYGLNGNRIYDGTSALPQHTIPPGTLKTNAVYKYQVRAISDHMYFEWDNLSASGNDLTRFTTGSIEAAQPHIDLRNIGVETWSYPPEYSYGPYTYFYAKIHDAQGVPDNIESVTVNVPGVGDVPLYLDAQETSTRGLYRGVYFGGVPTGTYTFNVMDKGGLPDSLQEPLTSTPIALPAEGTLTPINSTIVNGTGVNFTWGPVPEASLFQLRIFDQNYNKLFDIKTTANSFSMPPGLLDENTLYRYHINTRREFFEANVDNSYRVPPFNWNGNTFITTETNGSALPNINIDGYGVVVRQAPLPGTSTAHYRLEFHAQVSDADGVPQNIARVEVTYPDGNTKRILKYIENANWGQNYFTFEVYTTLADIQDTRLYDGIYTFEVVDFEENSLTVTDTLPDVTSNTLPWATNLSPTDGALVLTTQPTISWDPVPGAEYYQVRIMSAWNYPQVHFSGDISGTEYTIPPGELENNKTYGLLVYAFKEDLEEGGVDFFSSSRMFHTANSRFTVQLTGNDTDGDGMDDAWETTYFLDLSHDGNADSDYDGLIDREEFQYLTIPTDPDSDDDSFGDGQEIAKGTSPNNQLEYPTVIPLDLNNNGDYAWAPHSGSLDISGNQVTMEAWVRLDGTSGNHWIVCKQDISAIRSYGFYINAIGRGIVPTIQTDSYFESGIGPGTLEYGVWYHVAMVYDGSLIKTYINGEFNGEAALTGALQQNPRELTLGGTYWLDTDTTNGAIDEVRIWNTARTQGEIQAAMHQSLSGSETGLVGYWQFDAMEDLDVGGDGVDDFRDFSINSNHADWAPNLDADSDGLPDAWEQDIINYDTGDGINTIYDVNPGDDFDGDGVSNQAEYENGTLPTDSGDFTPPGTGAIRGTVRNSGGIPITTTNINVEALSGDPCGGWQHIQSVTTNSLDGTYIIIGLDPGSGPYYLRTDNRNASDFVNEWYASPLSSVDCAGAQSTPVTDGGLADNRDFQLDTGASISGYVYEQDDSTEIPNACVTAYVGKCWQNHYRGIQTDGSGYYEFRGMPIGATYYLLFEGTCSGGNYIQEWYNEQYDCNNAQPVAVGTAVGNATLDAGASISGTVQNDTGGTITDQWISVHAQGTTPNSSSQGTSVSQIDGTYTISGLAPGNYKIQANNNRTPGYVTKYFDDKPSMETADEVVVTSGQNVIGIDFTLEEGGTISGNIFIEGTSTPIPNVCVNVYADKCHQGWYQGSQTNSVGYYEIGGLPPGANVYIAADPACGGENYVLEWYGGTNDCNSAQPATVSATIDFDLEAAGSIAGHVEDTSGNDIIDLHIYATDYDTGEWFAGSNTDDFGNYTLLGLPSGDYRLRTASDNSGLQFADEYYDNVYNWESAARVTVTAPAPTPVGDLILEAGNTISGTITGLGPGQWININARSDNGTSNYSQDDLEFWAGINGSGSGTDAFTINVLPGYFYIVDFSPSDGLYVYFKTGETHGTWDWDQATRIEVNGNVTGIDVTVQADTDWDDVPDDWEDEQFGNLDEDGWGDWDGDGLNDRDEYRRGTLPKNPDSDGDKISDSYEVNWGTDPTQAADAPPIPVIGVIINIHKPGGIVETSVEVLVENGFVGTLPDDIDTITITGPGLSLTKSDLEFLPEWNEWATNVSGSPQLGQYTFTVTSGAASGTAYDTLTVNRTIPLADHTEFNPPDDAIITSPAPTFSWEAVNYPEATMYYRLEIRDLSDVRAYASGRVAGMLSHSVPASTLNPGQQYKWRVRVGDSPTWEGEENRSNSEWINFTMGTSLPSNASPGLDIMDRRSGVMTYTTNPQQPYTALSHDVMVVDYDGVAEDGSSHTVTVTYPNGGPTKTLEFNSRRDAHTAYYSLWDDSVGPTINPSVYDGNYVYTVEDPEQKTSQATDHLLTSAIDPPDETTFTPNFTDAQHIEAYFDNVQVNGLPYEDFEAGYFDLTKWNWQPPEVSYVGGEAKFENTWYPDSQSIGMNLKNPTGVTGFKANARVENITYDSTKGSVYARLAGRFCMDSRGEVHARVGIRGDEAVYSVYTEFWEGDHIIEIPLISDHYLGPVTQGNNYELTLDWNETTKTISFRVFGPHGPGNIDYNKTYTVTDYAGPAPNPYRQLSIIGWVIVDSTTPTFNWDPVAGATHYQIRIYGWNDKSLYWGEAKSPPYTLPAGIIKPGGIYKYRIYPRRNHQWFEWENVSASDREKARFLVKYEEAVDPSIDLNSLGVFTVNNQPPFGETTVFNIRIHDPQGVPGNIESFTVEVPGGDTVNLYYDEYHTPTEGKYRGAYFGSIPTGLSVYNFTVTDKDGHVDTETDTFTPKTVEYRERSELLPLHNTLLGTTGVTLDWVPPTGATNYWVAVYDKDKNRLLGIHTVEDKLVIPPGILKDYELYQYRIENYGQYPEDSLDSISTSPPGGLWAAPTFTTTAASGTSNPTISLGDFGVAVWQAPHPATGIPYSELDLMAFVSDPDGVPQNIARVEVKFPDGTIHQLKYDDSPGWNSNYIHYIQLPDTSSILDQSNSSGIYEFKVVDFEGNEATVQDILPDVNAATGVIGWPTNVAPVDGTIVTTTTPTITWTAVPGASYYKVRIMSAYDNPTVHWSEELEATQYTVPDGTLFNGATHGYRVYAYREPIGSEVDFYSSYSSWHATNNHFTIDLADSDGDGVFDEDDNCPGDDNPLQEDDDTDDIGNVCDNCPGDPNADQADANSDGVGDVCDTASDTDGDGLSDADEVTLHGTDPTNPDSDGDGYNDGLEISQGTQPRDGSDFSGIPNSERTALLALYTSTNGDGWTDKGGWKETPQAADGFALPGTECSWFGVTCDATEDHVTAIYLNGNQLAGSIPLELGNLAQLKWLHLYNNQLTGSIPAELGNLNSIETLWLSENQLSGSIPPELGNMTSLQYLYLFNNQITGGIPPELGDLNSLLTLDLASNQLTGSMPPELGNLSNLQYLYLYDNQLTGSMPPEIGNLDNLQHLYLYNNQLTGNILPELGNLDSIQWLLLFNNQLSGSIPTEIGNLNTLVALALGNNLLAGNIPTEIGNLTNLRELSLNSNQLTGSISTEWGNLTKLEFINIAGNQLTGLVPETLNNLTQLLPGQSDLRWNALYTPNLDLRTRFNAAQSGGDWENTQTIAPENLAALTIAQQAVALSWTAIAYSIDPGTYEVDISTDEAGPYSPAELYEPIADKTVNSTQVIGLTGGVTYWFRVRTATYAHSNNQNIVYSEYTVPIYAITGGVGMDSDGDGLDDGWELNIVNADDGDNILTIADVLPEDDFDDDSWPNLAEFQDEKSPTDNTDFPQLTQIYVGGSGASDANLGDATNQLQTFHEAMRRIDRMPDGTGVQLNLAGGTYAVGSGENDAPVYLNKNITINGGGAVLDGTGASNWTAGITIFPGATNVVINDLTITNFDTGLAVTSDGGCLNLTSVTIESCKRGISLVESYMLDLDMAGNSTTSQCETGIYVCAGSSNNLIHDGQVSDSTGDGIRLEGSGESPDDNRFENMQVSNNHGNGIIIYEGTGNLIYECEITGNNIDRAGYGGIAVMNGHTTVTRSTISGNQCQGVYSDTLTTEATYNYWGAADGPSGEGPGTTGDAVSEQVAFAPWFAAVPSTDTDGDGVADAVDNCPADPNSGQEDDDQDNIGNACDTAPGIITLAPGIYYVDPAAGTDDPAHGTAGQDGAWKTLHYALFLINAGLPGSYELRLAQGLYSTGNGEADAPLTIEQDLTLVGNNAELDGAGAANWSTGLFMSMGAANLTIRNLTVRNFKQGLAISTVGACVNFDNLTVTACVTGLQLLDSYLADVDLTGAGISGCETGIEITAGSANNTLHDGRVTGNNGNGILVSASNVAPSDNLIRNIQIDNNGLNGIAINGGAGTQVRDCTILNNNTSKTAHGGIALLSCNADIRWNHLEDNACSGIYLEESADSTIYGNLIHGSDEGIKLSFTYGTTIEFNTITGNQEGVVVAEGSAPSISYNIIWGNLGPSTDLSIMTDLDPSSGYTLLEYNDIGTTNLISLPTSNSSVDPGFKDVAGGDFSLNPTSPCIDHTDMTEAVGRDLAGGQRPLGNAWDMGAYESPNFADTDGDELPDWWENKYFPEEPVANVDPDGDWDEDGLSTRREYEIGTDPDKGDTDGDGLLDSYETNTGIYNGPQDTGTDPNNPDSDGDGVNDGAEINTETNPTVNPVTLTIVQPADSCHFTDVDTITLQGTAGDQNIISVTNNAILMIEGQTVQCGSETCPWSGDVDLLPGENLIEVTATEATGTYSSQAAVIVVLDSAGPSIQIDELSVSAAESTSNEIFIATSETINFTGTASDDTRIASVTWTRTAPGAEDANGVAVVTGSTPSCTESQNATWSAAGISLHVGTENTVNTVTVTVTDISGYSAQETRLIERQANQKSETKDNSEQGNAYTEQPVDQDGDEVEDSLDNCPLEPNTGQTDTDGDDAGNACDDDDDNDDLSDEWEVLYGLNPLNNDSNGNGTLDGDENPDDDAYDNKTEYDQGSNPLIPNLFELTIRDLAGGSDITDSWLPAYDTAVVIQARWTGGAGPANATFMLENVSTYPGRAVNDPNPAIMPAHGYPAWYYDEAAGVDNFHGPDFGLTAVNPTTDPTLHSFDPGPITVPADTSGSDPVYTVYLQSWDFGGRAKVMVSAAGYTQIGELWVPRGTNHENHIAAAWDHDNNPSTDKSFSPQEASDDKDRIESHVYADPDRAALDPPLQPEEEEKGDGFNVFEEYRGIIFTEGGTFKHLRLNPERPNLFVRAIGFDDATADVYSPIPLEPPGAWYPFRLGPAYKNCGIDIHNTTGWGHDGTADGSFFVYYAKGAIDSINGKVVTGSVAADWLVSWPSNEWEFKLAGDGDTAWRPIKAWAPGNGTIANPPQLGLEFDYPTNTPAGSALSYAIRIPVPHINVLLITLDRVTTKIKPDDDAEGFILFEGAAPPAPWGFETYGTRNWRWSTKGYSRWNRTDVQYGAAIPMQIPLDHYFSDDPYQKGTIWNGTSWDPAPEADFTLMPLNLSEDPQDTGEFLAVVDENNKTVHVYDGVVQGDTPNGNWDGDRRILNNAQWQTGGDLSPFDIDDDDIIENPTVTLVPDADANEQDDFGNLYTKQWVLKHTTTHEIGHAIGGLDHSDFFYCLMYGYSDDWKRDHFLSNQFRSRLKIHNQIRELPSEVF